jgi:hypothetical protein
VLANLLGYREDLGAKSFGVLDLDPRAVAQDDHAERRPLPILLFDEEEVGPELEPVPGSHPLIESKPVGTATGAQPARKVEFGLGALLSQGRCGSHLVGSPQSFPGKHPRRATGIVEKDLSRRSRAVRALANPASDA